ncbi:site-2 protease family protein [Listeria fleischmannii]|uniref:site-2 protease family protein n=1 Tax=Listeria fleischmannii TaxID=1069827 RepID=UPI001623D477|nr:site-2 protease family protein [Listeria fleischmannii]MBC1418748.1 site-2 protease family protein [Listeria fleischmannii]
MSNFLAYPLEMLPYVVVSILIAFTIHEWAHAATALLFGDDTAKNEGRFSINPLVHVDLIGLLMVVIVGFGWAKPTPVNRFKLKKRKLGSILVSLAGPISNLILAFLAVGIFAYFIGGAGGDGLNTIWSNFLTIFIQLNLVLFIFNLIPFPPLDGYQVLVEFLPSRLRAKVQPVEQYAFLIFLIIALTPLYSITIGPTIYDVVLDRDFILS